MIRVNLNPGLFLVPSNLSEYLLAEPVRHYPLKSSFSSCSETVTNNDDATRAAFRGVVCPTEVERECSLIESVLTYLCAQETLEENVSLRDDLRIAWLCVLLAGRGYADPWGFAFWSLYGKTWQKALVIWAERDAENQRALARMEAELEARRQALPLYETARNELKKPSVGVSAEKKRRRA